jgi:ABC-type transport system involved in multi-copper enzyme maturation permease subunit
MATLFQTRFGLLIVVIFTSLAFSEERRRGSLDVLLATPLSTRSIVWGKWLAAFRVLPLLAVGPTIVCWAFAQDDLSQFLPMRPAALRSQYMNLDGGGRAIGAALMPATILAHGAWISSLGLALSVWIRREGLALSLAVAAYVLYAIGIPILAIFLPGAGRNGPLGLTGWILASSPVFVVILLVEILSERPPVSWEILNWIAAWDVIAASAALILLGATVRAFDRKFDRVSEPWLQMPPRRRPRRMGTPHNEVVGNAPIRL